MESGLDRFDPEVDITKLQIPTLSKRVGRVAPELYNLLTSFMSPPRTASHRDTSTIYSGRVLMICSMLAQGRKPKTCTNLLTLLGLYLHVLGLKRRSLNVLEGLGVSSTYYVINKQ